MRNPEDGPRWDQYQVVLKELATNGYIDVGDHVRWAEYVDVVDYPSGSKVNNKLTAVMQHLSAPSSWRSRVRWGISIHDRATDHLTGAILRTGHRGIYKWDKDIVTVGAQHSTLVTDDEAYRKYNKRYRFRSPKADVPEVVEVVPEVVPEVPEVPEVRKINRATAPGLLGAMRRAAGKDTVVERAADLAYMNGPILSVLAEDGDRLVLRKGNEIILASVTDRFKGVA